MNQLNQSDMSQPETTSVISKDGARGILVEGMPTHADTSYAPVQFEAGPLVFVPLDALSLQAGGRYYYLNLRLDELAQTPGALSQASREEYVLPVVAEELDIQRQQVETGRIRVAKRVHERTEVADQPLLREEVTVERVPINQFIDQPVPVRHEGDTMIIPVLEEVLVVEKRLLLKEEVHLTRRTIETHQPQEVLLRSEEVLVERIAPVGAPPATPKVREVGGAADENRGTDHAG